jgi:hypothetical protein
VTSIERTAYPRFKRLITAHELHLFFAPSRDEVEWAAGRSDSDEHLLHSPTKEGFLPNVALVDDRRYEGLTSHQVLDLIPPDYQLWSIENNLSGANMDFEDFARAVDNDGVLRGF